MASVFSVSALQYARDSSYYAAPNTNTGPGNNFGVIGVQYAKDLPYFTPNVVANSGAGANFSASALAYGENASYYALSTNTPAPTPPPTGTLTAPVQFLLPENSDILAVRFDVAGVVGATSYGIYISPNTTLQNDILYPAQLVSGTIYQGSVTGLINNTPYYFWAIAFNALGSLLGPMSLPITTDTITGTAPSGPPGIPTFLSSTPTSLTFQTDSAGVTGTPTPQFLMNLQKDGGAPAFLSQQAVLSSGTLWETTFTGLTAGACRATAIAFNGISPNQQSSVSSAYSPS